MAIFSLEKPHFLASSSIGNIVERVVPLTLKIRDALWLVLEQRRLGNNRYGIYAIASPQLKDECPSPSIIHRIMRRYSLNRVQPKMKANKRKIIKQKAGGLGHMDCHHHSLFLYKDGYDLDGPNGASQAAKERRFRHDRRMGVGRDSLCTFPSLKIFVVRTVSAPRCATSKLT